MGELPDQGSSDVTVLDMEASIEHLTRGTVRNVDVLLVVTEPYYRSLETTGRVVPLARELGLERVWVVANKGALRPRRSGHSRVLHQTRFRSGQRRPVR
jgi:CO dehydrogenase nickel-insertion accessory protein CooC1